MAASLAVPGLAAASAEKVLYSFQGGSDGTNPTTGLIADSAGNLYGTTTGGGTGPCSGGCGTAFQLKLAGGHWIESVIYSFQGGSDGAAPSASLVFDHAGNLYGTTIGGGASLDGTIFELTLSTGGLWTESILHSFSGGDGAYPVDSLVFDQSGNLYGTTVFGGAFSAGLVFKLAPPAPQAGSWTETVLYQFKGLSDGIDPEAGLVMDQKGALYGTTIANTVFKLTPPAAGHTNWTFKVIYTFGGGGDNGPLSAGNLLPGRNGMFYGTEKFGGGPDNAGAVFQLTPPATQGGVWTSSTIYRFTGGSDGAYPLAGLIADKSGNLYGTTTGDGRVTYGTAFRLSPPQGGGWTLTTLYSFTGGSDGSGPSAALIFGKGGALYGTTAGGGDAAKGTVFSVVP